MAKILFKIIFISLLFFAIPAQAGSDNWPADCGHRGQNTCMGPIHTGCKGDLEKCDMPNARDICEKKGNCPKDSRNKAGCSNCGHEGQKPCILAGKCKMCVKHHHVSAITGHCTKTNSLETMLKHANEKLTKYEKKCHKGLKALEGQLDKNTSKKLEKLLDNVDIAKNLLSATTYSVEMEKICAEEALNGAACGIIAWVKSYNNLLLYLIKGHSIDKKEITKAAIEQSKKYMRNILYNDACKNIMEPFGRTMCAAIETIADDAKKPIKCISLTIKDATHLKKTPKKKISDKDKKEFVKNSCYQVASFGVGIAADQSLALLTAEIGEAVELPKDVKAFVNLAQKIAEAKISLENAIDKKDEIGRLVKKSKINKIMKSHKSCKPLIKFLD